MPLASITDPTVQQALKNANPLQHQPSPADWRNQLIYLIMVDRFNNPAKPPSAPWNQPYGNFQGGTFAGIQEQLPYLKGLGVGALWLTPVFKNCSYEPTYHGYGIQNFLAVDPRFASNPAQVEQELKNLIQAAHNEGIYIILDIVLHHAGNVFAYTNLPDVAPWNSQSQPYPILWHDEHGQPAWATPPAQETISPEAMILPRELRANELFERRGTTDFSPATLQGDFDDLRSFYQDDSGNMPALQTLITTYQYAIAAYDIDGFRIDTLMYISPQSSRVFANAMREFAFRLGKDNFFVFGEIWSDEETIARFVGRDTRDPDTNVSIGIDAALDYPLFYALPNVCKGFSPPSQVASVLQKRKIDEQYTLSTHGEASNFFVTFLDNHDQYARFYFPPDDAQVTLALACLLSLPGIPCLYYGTEQGLSGSGNAPEAVRQALWGKPDNPFDRTNPFYQAIRTLVALRSVQPALCYGRHYFRPIAGDATHFAISQTTPGVLSYSRILDGQEVVVIANTNTVTEWSGAVLIDASLNQISAYLTIVYSNLGTNGKVQIEQSGPTTVVQEEDGSSSAGPVCMISARLLPMEVQILVQ